MPERDPGWWRDAAGPPIRVEGGVKARSKRGRHRRAVVVAAVRRGAGVVRDERPAGPRPQLRPARPGAGVALTQGMVQGAGAGLPAAPYQVRIGVLPLTTAQWQRVHGGAARRRRCSGPSCWPGRCRTEIEEVFADCGTPLFPRSARDLDMSCSCPDWEVPCKHLAAVCYVLAERFDDDPFAMLAWRGRGRDGPARPRCARPRLARGRARRRGAAVRLRRGAGGPGAARWPSAWTDSGRRGEPGPAPCRPGHPAGTAPDLLLRSAEPPDVQIRGTDLATLLGPAYQRCRPGCAPGPGRAGSRRASARMIRWGRNSDGTGITYISVSGTPQ